MSLKIKKQIYDNVHGHIGLTETELDVVDSPLFQRLKSIHQLGTTNFVYPGATHTRFEHSIGTMFMVDQFLSNVKKDNQLLTEDSDMIQKMRLAGLLHDIGHYPLSHTVEHMIVRKLNGMSHVEFGSVLINNFFDEILSSYRIAEITDIISGKNTTELGMVVSSAFDADKSDYLLRDSYYTGVGYGKIGLQRLIRTVSFDNNRIIFDKDEAAVESFLMGRYHMFRSVYHHKTVTAFEVMVERILEYLINEGQIEKPDELIKNGDELRIFGYNDHMLFSKMHSYMLEGKNKFTNELIRMFLLRKPVYAAYINPMPGEGKDTYSENRFIESMTYNDAKIQKFAEDAKIGEWQWIFPIYLRPLGLVDDKTPIYIRDRQSVSKLVNSNALVLHMIGKNTLYDARIYTHDKYKNKVIDFMKKQW
jgi:HD superfamily phosphohydrolase